MPNAINCRLLRFWGLIAARLENNLKFYKNHIVLLNPLQKLQINTVQNGTNFILPLKG